MAKEKFKIKFDKKEFIESAVLGVAGLIAFSIIATLVYFVGLIFRFKSLKYGFISEVLLIRDFPVFFTLVAIVKILIGGELIYIVTKLLSKFFKVKILADKKRIKKI